VDHVAGINGQFATDREAEPIILVVVEREVVEWCQMREGMVKMGREEETREGSTAGIFLRSEEGQGSANNLPWAEWESSTHVSQ
jgi:hypothetical protein